MFCTKTFMYEKLVQKTWKPTTNHTQGSLTTTLHTCPQWHKGPQPRTGSPHTTQNGRQTADTADQHHTLHVGSPCAFREENFKRPQDHRLALISRTSNKLQKSQSLIKYNRSQFSPLYQTHTFTHTGLQPHTHDNAAQSAKAFRNKSSKCI